MLEKWTSIQDESLIDQYLGLGRPISRIIIPSRTVAAINNRLGRLVKDGQVGQTRKARKLVLWSDQERALVKNYTECGFSAEKITTLGLLPGRTRYAISQLMRRHGLGDPKVKDRARKAKRLSKDERKALREYLLAGGPKLPSAEVAAKFGITPGAVRSHRRKLGMKITWRESRQHEAYQKFARRQRELFVRATVERSKKWRTQVKRSFHNLAEIMREGRSVLPSKTCRLCRGEFFASSLFFHALRKQKTGSIRVYLRGICRVCASKARRKAGRSIR